MQLVCIIESGMMSWNSEKSQLKLLTVFQVSIIAMQRGEQLMPFKTKSGDTLEILYLEDLTAEVSVDFISFLGHCGCFLSI